MNKYSSCVFCDLISGRNQIKTLAGKFDNYQSLILGMSENFILISDIAPLVIGHFLIIPKRHIDSLSFLKMEELVELDIIIKSIVNITPKEKISFFEHGIINEKNICCIHHAHLHVLFSPHDATTELLNINTDDFFYIDKIHSLSRYKNNQYIYYKNPSEKQLLLISDFFSNQVIRKIIGNIDNNEKWNWNNYLVDNNNFKDRIEKNKEMFFNLNMDSNNLLKLREFKNEI